MSAMTSAPSRLALCPALLIDASPACSLDRQRIDRRANRTRNRDCRRDEQKFVSLVLLAIVRELLELEDLAHGHAHDRDRDPVPGLVDVLALGDRIRPHLAPPCVAGKRRQLGVLDEIERLEGKTRRIAARIAVPRAELLAALHHAGADDDVVTTLELDLLLLRRAVKIVVGDAVTVVKRVDTLVPGNVEEHAAADHLVLGLLDAAFLRPR